MFQGSRWGPTNSLAATNSFLYYVPQHSDTDKLKLIVLLNFCWNLLTRRFPPDGNANANAWIDDMWMIPNCCGSVQSLLPHTGEVLRRQETRNWLIGHHSNLWSSVQFGQANSRTAAPGRNLLAACWLREEKEQLEGHCSTHSSSFI